MDDGIGDAHEAPLTSWQFEQGARSQLRILDDLAVRKVYVTDQSIIIDCHPETRSRLVGGYMVFYSIGSALGPLLLP